MCYEDENEFIDITFKQNNIIDERNPDLEIAEEYDRNMDEMEEE